jgi:hypothetical protein
MTRNRGERAWAEEEASGAVGAAGGGADGWKRNGTDSPDQLFSLCFDASMCLSDTSKSARATHDQFRTHEAEKMYYINYNLTNLKISRKISST